MKKHFWLNLFLILAGVVIGSMVAHYSKGVSFLSWLNFGLKFGTTGPVAVELGVVSFTLGINFNLSVATIICVALSLVVGKFIVRK